eukprot:TRINITY_DN750_c0_g1_i1.p1 TRINITY_DN750_c0_g1~~TRINITY_DN750_c0_g1_i1.p1  ORF type:complete len:206 (+),score=43.57 TRINITY_DN750_c0_g1_i1:172-789(+)
MSCECKDHIHGSDSGSDRGAEFSLFQSIAVEQTRALNEKISGSVRSVFKPWDKRLEKETFMESNDDDPELILYIPFNGVVKLRSIIVIGGEDGTSPSKLRIFTNREDIDFSNASDIAPIQEFDLHEDPTGQVEYTPRVAKFTNISSLTFHIPTNFGADFTKIYYIGLKGEFHAQKREAVIAIYESKPQLSDHKSSADQFVSRSIQ